MRSAFALSTPQNLQTNRVCSWPCPESGPHTKGMAGAGVRVKPRPPHRCGISFEGSRARDRSVMHHDLPLSAVHATLLCRAQRLIGLLGHGAAGSKRRTLVPGRLTVSTSVVTTTVTPSRSHRHTTEPMPANL